MSRCGRSRDGNAAATVAVTSARRRPGGASDDVATVLPGQGIVAPGPAAREFKTRTQLRWPDLLELDGYGNRYDRMEPNRKSL